MTLTEIEVAVLKNHEDALAILIAFHDLESQELGYKGNGHEQRAQELRAYKKSLPLRFR